MEHQVSRDEEFKAETVNGGGHWKPPHEVLAVWLGAKAHNVRGSHTRLGMKHLM